MLSRAIARSYRSQISIDMLVFDVKREGVSLAQKRIVDYLGRKVEGEVVEFDPVPESWTNYKLADGTMLKIKVSLLDVVRLINEFHPQTGDPVYVFAAQQITNINSPENLKQKK
jgi:hypothetical protein